MMINVVLYDEKAVVKVAKKAKKYLSKQEFFRTTNDTIWTKDLYLKFYPNLITVNAFNTSTFTQQQLSDCLLYIFKGEEVFILNGHQENLYIEKVNCTTEFDTCFAIKGV